jgi:hypothetical protein
MDWGQVAVGVGALVVGLFGGRWTRQSAKESNAGQLYSGLTAAQGAELLRMTTESQRTSERLTALEKDRAESRKLARVHERWDQAVVRKLRAALPDEEFPDPPPLDT